MLPLRHTDHPIGCSTPELPSGSLSLATAEAFVRDHLRTSVAQGVPWQVAVDSLRPITNELWSKLSPDDRRAFVAGPMRSWEVARHRMAPRVARRFDQLLCCSLVNQRIGQVAVARDIADGIEVDFDDGSSATFGAVVRCTGPSSPRETSGPAGALLGNLEHDGAITFDDLDTGIDVDHRGRARNPIGDCARALYVVGPLRCGSPWEATSIPEIVGN